MKEIDEGDRLISVQPPGPLSGYHVMNGIVQSITVGKLPGPMGYYLTAQVQFKDGSPDVILPLHMVEKFEIQFGD